LVGNRKDVWPVKKSCTSNPHWFFFGRSMGDVAQNGVISGITGQLKTEAESSSEDTVKLKGEVSWFCVL